MRFALVRLPGSKTIRWAYDNGKGRIAGCLNESGTILGNMNTQDIPANEKQSIKGILADIAR